MRVLLIIAALLLWAAPAGAATLDYSDDTYLLQGTPERDLLSVTDDGAAVVFTAEGDTLTGSAELPEGCAPLAADTIRCTLTPRRKTLVDGGAGDDELTGSRFAEYMLAGDGNDRLRPGLGADHLDLGAGHDTLDFSADERTAGVVVSDGNGPDSGDSFSAGVDRLIGTRHADSFIMLDRRTSHEIETLGGADYINTADSYGARSPGDRLECGRGVDLYRTSYTDEDLIGCEEAGQGLGEPIAGHLAVTYEARYLPGRALSFSGGGECRAGGAPCTLEIEVNGFGRTIRRIRPGEGAPATHVLSRREFARAEAKGKAVRRIRFRLRKPGFPTAWAQLSRDISP